MTSSPTRGRRGALATAVVVAAAVLAAALFLMDGRSDSDPKKDPMAQRIELPEADRIRIEAALRSGDSKSLPEAVALPSDQPLNPAFRAWLRGLEAFEISAGPMHRTNSKVATTTATVVDGTGQTTNWTLTMVLVGGRWVIAATDPA